MATARTTDFDPWDLRVVDDPYPALALLRENAPVHFVEKRGYWTVAGYADVQECLRDTETFSSNLMYGNSAVLAPTPEELEVAWQPQPIYPVPRDDAAPAGERPPVEELVSAVFEIDPPEHNRPRRLLVRPLRHRSTDSLESEIRTVCDELFDDLTVQMREGGMAWFKASYARPLALRITSKLMGVPQEHAAYLGRLAEATLGYFALEPSHRREFETAYPELCGYFFEHLAEHGYSDPRSGEISMINPLRQPNEDGDEPLSAIELLSNAAALFRGGFETTVNTMTNAMVALLGHPDQHQEVAEDPGLLAGLVEEGMRYDGPVLGVFRVATCDTEVAGQKLRAGSLINLLFAAANRDPAQFDSPDTFDVHRANADDQLSFGYGRHFCLGAPLARMEARIAFETLLARVKNLRLAAPAPVYRHTVLRGRTEVPIAFDLA